MFLFLLYFLLAIFIPLLLILLAKLLAARSNMDREKLSPFECGFDPKNTARTPFSLRFFLLAVIFLVFDIEIALLMPTPLILSKNILLGPYLTTFSFFLILLLGLLHEWNEGSLDWAS